MTLPLNVGQSGVRRRGSLLEEWEEPEAPEGCSPPGPEDRGSHEHVEGNRSHGKSNFFVVSFWLEWFEVSVKRTFRGFEDLS